MEYKTIEQRCLDFALDLHTVLKGEKIPDHEHWNDPATCGNLRYLIAAFAKKHFGDLLEQPPTDQAELPRGEP